MSLPKTFISCLAALSYIRSCGQIEDWAFCFDLFKFNIIFFSWSFLAEVAGEKLSTSPAFNFYVLTPRLRAEKSEVRLIGFTFDLFVSEIYYDVMRGFLLKALLSV